MMASRYFEGFKHASLYAKFRPHPPASLINKIISFLKEKYSGSLAAAVDVGCGSGQSTAVLAPLFQSVTGLDASAAQIKEAATGNVYSNVEYRVGGAETLAFANSTIQLVTACQSCHWFDLPKFYQEAERILVPGGILALYGYLFPKPIYGSKTEDLYKIIDDFYMNKTGGYWGSERIDVDLAYTGDRFKLPFMEQFRDDTHFVDKTVSVVDLTGYVSTWSGFQNYRKKYGDTEAEIMLRSFQERILSVIDMDVPPEEIAISLRFQYFLIMGRKPLC